MVLHSNPQGFPLLDPASPGAQMHHRKLDDPHISRPSLTRHSTQAVQHVAASVCALWRPAAQGGREAGRSEGRCGPHASIVLHGSVLHVCYTHPKADGASSSDSLPPSDPADWVLLRSPNLA